MHVIGPIENPIMVCQKKEVKKLFTAEFWQVCEIWQYFHYGFGLPGGLPWDEQDPELMRILLTMQKLYENEFSHKSASLKYLESIIRHQKAGMGMKK